jgi:hypothetical protein
MRLQRWHGLTRPPPCPRARVSATATAATPLLAAPPGACLQASWALSLLPPVAPTVHRDPGCHHKDVRGSSRGSKSACLDNEAWRAAAAMSPVRAQHLARVVCCWCARPHACWFILLTGWSLCMCVHRGCCAPLNHNAAHTNMGRGKANAPTDAADEGACVPLRCVPCMHVCMSLHRPADSLLVRTSLRCPCVIETQRAACASRRQEAFRVSRRRAAGRRS